MNEKIIRLPQVKEMVGLGTTAIYGKMKSGDFPKQIKMGRASGWVESEVQAWITQQIKASRPDQAEGGHQYQVAEKPNDE